MHEHIHRARSRLPLVVLLLCALVHSGIAGADDDDFQLLWWNSDIQKVLSDAENAASRAANAATDAGTVATRVQNARTKILNLQDTIEEAVGDLKSRVDEMNEGRGEFLGNDCDSNSPCGQFRGEMLGVIDDFALSNNALLRAANLDVEADFGRLRSLVQQAPGRALFPLYRVLDGHLPIMESGFSDMLSELALHLDFLALALAPAEQSVQFDAPSSCDILLDDPAFSQNAVVVTTGAGVVLTLLGKTLDGLGETHLEGKAGVHGYPGILVKQNSRKQWGALFSGLGDGVGRIATAGSNKLRYCTMVENQRMVLANQRMILDNQRKLWNAMPPGWTSGDEILTPGGSD